MAPKATRAASRRQEGASTAAAPAPRRMTRARAAQQGVSLPTSFATPPDVARGRRRGGEPATVAKKPLPSPASLKTPAGEEEDDDAAAAEEEEEAAPKELSSPIVTTSALPPSSLSAVPSFHTAGDFISRLVESRKDASTPSVGEDRSEPSPVQTPSRSKQDVMREKYMNWQDRILERKRKAIASPPEDLDSTDEVAAKRPRGDVSNVDTPAKVQTPEQGVSTPARSGFLSSLRTSIAGSAAKLMGVFSFRSEPPKPSQSAKSPDSSQSALSHQSPSAAGHSSKSRHLSNRQSPTLEEEVARMRKIKHFRRSNNLYPRLSSNDPLYLRPMLPRSILRAQEDAKYFRKRAILRHFGHLPPEEEQERAERIAHERELWTIESKRKRDRGEPYEPFVPSKKRKLDITWDELPQSERLTHPPFLSSDPNIPLEQRTLRINLSPQPEIGDGKMLEWDEENHRLKKSEDQYVPGYEPKVATAGNEESNRVEVPSSAYQENSEEIQSFGIQENPTEAQSTFHLPQTPGAPLTFHSILMSPIINDSPIFACITGAATIDDFNAQRDARLRAEASSSVNSQADSTGYASDANRLNDDPDDSIYHSFDVDKSEISAYEDAQLYPERVPVITHSGSPLPSGVGRTFEVPSSPSLVDYSPHPANESEVGRTFTVPDSPTSGSETGSTAESPSFNSLVHWSMCQSEKSDVGRTFSVPDYSFDSDEEVEVSGHSQPEVENEQLDVQNSVISQDAAPVSQSWSSAPVVEWTRDQYVDFAISQYDFTPTSLNKEALRRSTIPEHDRMFLKAQIVVKAIYERAFFELKELADATRREISEGLNELREAVQKEKSQLLYVADELQKRKAGHVSQYDAAFMSDDALGASPSALTKVNPVEGEPSTPFRATVHPKDNPETPAQKSSSVGWSKNVSFDHSTPGPHKPAPSKPATPKSILKSASKFIPKKPSGLRNVESSNAQASSSDMEDDDRIDEDTHDEDAMDEDHPEPNLAVSNGEDEWMAHKPYALDNLPSTHPDSPFHQAQKEMYDISKPSKTAESVMRDTWNKNRRNLHYLDVLPEDLDIASKLVLPSFISDPEPFIDPKDCLGRRVALEAGKLIINGKAKGTNFFFDTPPNSSSSEEKDAIILPDTITEDSRVDALLLFKQ